MTYPAQNLVTADYPDNKQNFTPSRGVSDALTALTVPQTNDLLYTRNMDTGRSSPAGTAYLRLPGVTVFDASTLPAMVKAGSGGGVGTYTASTINFWPGSTAAKLTCTAGAGTQILWTQTATIWAAGTFTGRPTFRCPVFFENFASVSTVSVYFSFVDATFTNNAGVSWAIGPGGAGKFKQSDWQVLNTSYVGSNWTETGTVDWTTQCYAIRFVFNVAATGGYTSTIIHVDDVVLGVKAKAKIIPVFDFGYANQYTYARPLLNSLGIRANFALTPGTIDSSGTYMTTAQVKQLISEGHKLAFRPTTGFASQSVQQCVDGAKAAQDYISQLFGSDGDAGRPHIIYNQGQYWPGSGGTLNAIGDRTVVNRLRDELGVITGRTTETTNYPDCMSLGNVGSPTSNVSSTSYNYYESRVPNILTHGIIGFWGGNTLAGLKGQVDEAIIDGRAIVLFDHTWGYGDTDAKDPNNRRQFWEYVAQQRGAGLIDTMTYQDFCAQM